MDYKDEETKTALCFSVDGEAWWCDSVGPIVVPGLPELRLFPRLLTWHHGDSSVERPYVKTVTYYPDLATFRRVRGSDSFRLKYRSVRDAKSWVVFTAAGDRSMWTAEKYFRGRSIGMTVGRPHPQFWIHLAQLPIPEEEKHLLRDWPADRIADIFGRPREDKGLAPEEKASSIQEFCRDILASVQKVEGLGRAEAAALLCETIQKEAAADVKR